MGCDIHGFIEKRKMTKNTAEWDMRWKLAAMPELHRNYTFFGILAGVRQPEHQAFDLRGFPADASHLVQRLFDEDGPDAHTASYITREELELYLTLPSNDAFEFCKAEFKELITDMRRYPEYITRFVFWFDN